MPLAAGRCDRAAEIERTGVMKQTEQKQEPCDPADPWARAAREMLLRSEIGFWREMLAESGDALPAESLERMRQALALAEGRLLQLITGETCRDGSRTGPLGPSPAGRGSIH